MPRILVVEDRENLRSLLVRVLAPHFEVDQAADGTAALGMLATGGYAVVLSDVKLPGATGDRVLAEARRLSPPPEVVLMTAYAEVPAAVAALKAGAYDYLAKPFEPEDVLRVVQRAAERHALVNRARELEALLDQRESPILGQSPPMVAVRRMVERVGPMPVTVLLLGESGTGKEVVARELARLYGRGRFVAVNCGAIPETLLEAELFGAARGSYTGANQDRPGLFEEADGGTLFLDEIAELPLALQVKLNRALEEGEVRRLGENKPRRVNVRIVAATHQDLDRRVADGLFRADLLYRLKVVTIALPPLRDRVEDVPILAARFLRLAASRLGTPARRLDADALAALERYTWPGNVRELRHALEHAAVVADGETIGVGDLPEALRASAPPVTPGTWREAMERAQDRAGRDYLVGLLQRTGGNVTRAAAEAGVERETLHRLLRKHGLEADRFRDK
jgi:DNA-binding NtrC family response regulator